MDAAKPMDAAMKTAEPTVKSRKSAVKRPDATKAAAVKRAEAAKAAAVEATKAAAAETAKATTTVEASTSKASRFECCWRDRYQDC